MFGSVVRVAIRGCEGVCGLCCHQKPFEGSWFVLLAFMGMEASFTVILMTVSPFFLNLEIIYSIYFKLIKIIQMSFLIFIMENRFPYMKQLPGAVLLPLLGPNQLGWAVWSKGSF